MASHLTLQEREVIAHMHRAGKRQTQIADRLGRNKSTISRELQRNRSRNGYWAVAAQRKAERRRSERPWVARMQRPEVRRYVQDRLRQRWSAEAQATEAGRSRWSSGSRDSCCWAGSPACRRRPSARPLPDGMRRRPRPCGRL
jgi:IS30 family transposase